MSIEENHPVLTECHTRFLYPFFLNAGEVESASKLLQNLSFFGGSALAWKCRECHDLYVEETLPHVNRFLFPHNGEPGRCNYLEIDNDVLNRIFHDGLVLEVLSKDRATKKFNVQRTGIEVFLNENGLGVLSINLRLEGSGFLLGDALTFNHQLIQPRQKSPFGLRQPHPLYEPEEFPGMPENLRQHPPPADNTSLEERLGERGGRFWLSELAQALLQPLDSLGFQPMLRADTVQAQFWIYSVVRFGDSINWNHIHTRKQFIPFISALAQVEESDHAEAVEDSLGVPNSIQNAKHWAAVGLMGAVHLMADQPDDHTFNTTRVGRVMRKYFITYLMALFQRLMLQRAMKEAGDVVRSTEAAAKLAILRQSLLEFGVGGHFGQISSRHSVQRFFTVAVEGLGVNAAWQEIRQAIDDLNAKFITEQTLKLAAETKTLAEGQKHATEGLLRLQASVHWIEVFVVSVYSAELWHIFADETESLHRFISAGVVICAVLGFVAALIVLKPWRHRPKTV